MLFRWEKAGSNHGVIGNAPCLCSVLRDKGMGCRYKQQRRQEEGGGPHGWCSVFCVRFYMLQCILPRVALFPSSGSRHFFRASLFAIAATPAEPSREPSAHLVGLPRAECLGAAAVSADRFLANLTFATPKCQQRETGCSRLGCRFINSTSCHSTQKIKNGSHYE